MKVSDVTREDGVACAHLLNILKTGRWDLSAQDAETLVNAKKWLASLAGVMASSLRTQETVPSVADPTPSTSMRVKSVGPIGGTPGAAIKKSRKK